MPKEIKTSWGKITSDVSLVPIYYLMFIYGFIYILPYGRDLIGISWFDWFRSEDGPLEWIQFVEYAISSLIAFCIYIRRKKKREINSIVWLLIAFSTFVIAGEEISWGQRLFGLSINGLSNINVQGETNLHNLPFFQNYLLDPFFQVICLFFGWLGWKKFKNIDAFPNKNLSLYFLFVSLFYFYFDISWASTTEQIRNDQEIFEVLLSTGIFLHCFKSFKRTRSFEN